MWSSVHRLFRNDRAAIAPTVALALFGLIAVGGIAFDYSRLAAMDTELQQAADQAALAAATQLDRGDGAQDRATAAIQNAGTNRLAANITRFANDGNSDGPTVEIESITFCSAFDDTQANNADACTETNDDANSQYVIVTTRVRTADFAFTPIVAAFSGSSEATAVAGVEASICNVAPLFVCTSDDNFPTDADIGRGLLMKTGSGNSWAPGNYGLLDFGPGNPGVIDALLGHGLNGCQATSATNTEPGNKNVTDAINTRMDVYGGSPATSDPSICDTATGTGCPAMSARKDMVVTLSASSNNDVSSIPPAAPNCPANPKTAGLQFQLPTSPVEGFPRDSCHYSGTCADGNFGDKAWDRAGYFTQNHTVADEAAALTFAGKANLSDLTRYDVYRWELSNAATLLAPKRFVTTVSTQRKNGRWDHTVTSQCTYSQPVYGSTAYPAEKDRRVLPVLAADCDALNGKGNAGEDFHVIRAFDVFLTEPSEQRTYPGVTDDKEIYGEVVGPAETVEGSSGLQYYSRIKPYLVR